MREYIRLGLTVEEYEALSRLAERELRPIPMQVQHMVVDGLRRRRLLTAPTELRKRGKEAANVNR